MPHVWGHLLSGSLWNAVERLELNPPVPELQKVCRRLKAMRVGRVYRELMRAVEKHVGKTGKKRHFRDFIAEEFHKNSQLPGEATAQRELKLARDYTFLLNSIHHHKELLFSYNIAVDRSDEMRKTLKRSAASVGLRLPDVYRP